MLQVDNVHLYQIYYDDASFQALDAGFIPLDNRSNERPDWSEYWPIRHFLRTHALKEDDYYAFLSPKFELKTQLNAAQLMQFVQASQRDDVDAFIVSPFWDQAVFFQNVFEQGDFWHPGLMAVTQTFLQRIGNPTDLERLITHGQNTVFCNYIVAKPRFWYRWLALVEQLFNIAEASPEDELGRCLTLGTRHNNQYSYPFKVFIQERLATLILATESFNVVSYPLYHLPTLIDVFESCRSALLDCDAHKQAFVRTGHVVFERAYRESRRVVQQALDRSGLLPPVAGGNHQ